MKLAQELLNGNRQALSRLLSLAERNDPSLPESMQEIYPHTGRAHTIGITGPPGSGKSTLVDRLTELIRKTGASVGILAVDPSSPLTGGALLGDRVRMRQHYLDPKVFIRSMSNRGEQGGLPSVAGRALKLLDAYGKDVVFLETVGVGQSELAVMEVVDTVVVVTVPEGGDAIQALKAGILEVADILVVNKADRVGAQRMAGDLEFSVRLGSRHDWWTPPVVQTQAHRNVGVEALIESINLHKSILRKTGNLAYIHDTRWRREFIDVIRDSLTSRLAKILEKDVDLGELINLPDPKTTDPYVAGQTVLQDKTTIKHLLEQLYSEQ